MIQNSGPLETTKKHVREIRRVTRMTEQEVRRIVTAHGKQMHRFGYLPL